MIIFNWCLDKLKRNLCCYKTAISSLPSNALAHILQGASRLHLAPEECASTSNYIQ